MVDIKLKNKRGVDQIYYGVEKLGLQLADDSGEVEFGILKEEQTKQLSLSATAPSNVLPDEGKVLSSVTVNVDDSIVTPENIKKDVSILGVTGTFTSDATATANKILTGETAYVNGTKITGTIPTYDGSVS